MQNLLNRIKELLEPASGGEDSQLELSKTSNPPSGGQHDGATQDALRKLREHFNKV